MEFEKGLVQLLTEHSYSTSKLSESYKLCSSTYKSFIMNPSYLLKLHQNFQDENLDIFVNRFMKLFSGYVGDNQRTKEFTDFLYFELLKSFATPRGSLDRNALIVVGIAPSSGKLKDYYGEPCWLHGPSSRNLHIMLGGISNVYFTNVCKNPFAKNEYNEFDCLQWLCLLGKEFDFFKGNKVLLLGKYSIYEKIMQNYPYMEYSIIEHPTYFCYRGKDELQKAQEKIMRYYNA